MFGTRHLEQRATRRRATSSPLSEGRSSVKRTLEVLGEADLDLAVPTNS